MVETDKGKFISSINGSYDTIKLDDLKKDEETKQKHSADVAAKVNKQADKTGESKIIKQTYKADKVISGGESGLNLLKEIDPKCGMDVEQKIVYMEYVIKRTRPFYYYMLASLNKKYTCKEVVVNRNTGKVNKIYFEEQVTN